MHSDMWADVPYDQCPPEVQKNIRICSDMDRFFAEARSNRYLLESYVDSLYLGQSMERPAAILVRGLMLDRDTALLMKMDMRDCGRIMGLLAKGSDADLINEAAADWMKDLQRKSEYLAYNRKALEKRYRKGADQEEIDRVKKLISDGEEEIAFLQPRVEWARQKVL